MSFRGYQVNFISSKLPLWLRVHSSSAALLLFMHATFSFPGCSLPSSFDSTLLLLSSERLTPIHHLTKIQNHGTKRGRSGGSPDLSTRKRVKPGVDITSLAPAQLTILSQAADILQISVADLADLPKAIKEKSRRFEQDHISQAILESVVPQQVSIMESMPSRSSSSIQTTKPKSNTQPRFRSDNPHEPAPNEICDIHSFSLGLIPKQISDCFASFKSPTARLALPAQSQG